MAELAATPFDVASRRGTRPIGVLAVLGLTLALALPPVPAGATHQPPAARDTEQACPPDQVPGSGFTDIAGSVHRTEIACIAWWQVTLGRTATVYDPSAPVRRDQMASFVARKLETAGVDVPWDAPPAFDDVPADGAHDQAVNALAELGVVVGYGDGAYRPEDSVRRDQMASLISRSAAYTLGAALTDDHQWFNDVDEDNTHFAAVNGLAAVAIAAGRDAEARIYDPRSNVRRGAMASFLARTLDLYAADGVVLSPAPATARAALVDADGADVGEVTFTERDDGTVEVAASTAGLPPGFHGFHIHEAGACEPDFGAAGGHYNPDGQAHGDHAGDMPVLLVTGDGTAEARFVTHRVTIDELLADDGTAVIIHEGRDNYANIPPRYAPDGPDEDTLATGDAGGRIACGVVATID